MDITVLIVTSPIRSNPSTQMLEQVLAGLCLVPGLARAPWILVCDGFTVATDKQQPKHKGGIIAQEHIERYLQFIALACELLERLSGEKNEEPNESTNRVSDNNDDGANSDNKNNEENVNTITMSTNKKNIVLTLNKRMGFGFAVKEGLKLVKTPFVFVVQHDQRLVRPFDLGSVLRVMSQFPARINYVGLTSVSTQTYERYAPSKFGIHVKSTREFGGLPLLPLIFFYDKPHIVPTQHYRDVVLGFDSIVKRGDFIEETYGVSMRRDIMKRGMAAHKEYGTFQLDERDEKGVPLIYIAHVNGRAFLSAEQRAACGWPEQGRHMLLKKGRCLDAKAANEAFLTQTAPKEQTFDRDETDLLEELNFDGSSGETDYRISESATS